METTTILLIVAIIILCAIPVVIAKRKKSKKEKELLETISKIAGTTVSIDNFDHWGGKAIAIDNSNKKLFFITSRNVDHKVIDLSSIQRAFLLKSHFNGSESSGISKVELSLVMKDKGHPNAELEFYDSSHDSLTIRDELSLAEKWATILQDSVSQSNARI